MSFRVLLLALDMDFLDAPGDRETGAGHLYVKECVEVLKQRNIETLVICRQNSNTKKEKEFFGSVTLQRVVIGPKTVLPKEFLFDKETLINNEVDRILLENNFESTLIHSFYWYSGMSALYLKERFPSSVLIHSIISLGKVKHLWKEGRLSDHDFKREQVEKKFLKYLILF